MRTKYLLAPILAVGLTVAACDVEQTEDGEMPEVDVSVDEGNLPEYGVDAPEITAGTVERQVEVPELDVDVTTEQQTVDVPVVGIEAGDVDGENN